MTFNVETQKEPFYLLTLKDSNDEEYQIKIDRYSNPSKISFDFCIEHNLDIYTMKHLKKTIKKILKKFEFSVPKKDFLNGNNNPIEEVDEENSIFYSSTKNQKKSFEEKSEKITEGEAEKSKRTLDTKPISNNKIDKRTLFDRYDIRKMIHSVNVKHKTIQVLNNYFDYNKFISMDTITKTKRSISPMIEKTINKFVKSSDSSNYQFQNNSSDLLIDKAPKKSSNAKNRITSDNLNSFCSPNTINLFHNYNFIMKSENPLTTNNKTIQNNNNNFFSTNKNFIVNYSENDIFYKKTSARTLKPKKLFLISNKKSKKYKGIRNILLSESEKISPNNSKYNTWKKKSNNLKNHRVFKDKTISFNGTQVVATTIDLKKESGSSLYNYKTIQSISPKTNLNLMTYRHNSSRCNDGRVVKNSNNPFKKLLSINEDKSRHERCNLKAKTPKIFGLHKHYTKHNLNINTNTMNKRNTIFSSKSTKKVIFSLNRNELPGTNDNNKISKAIISNNFNKNRGNDLSKVFNSKKKQKIRPHNTNPFMSFINLEAKNPEFKNINKKKTSYILSKKCLFTEKTQNKKLFNQSNYNKIINTKNYNTIQNTNTIRNINNISGARYSESYGK